jgi:hypothetical protein
MRFNGYVLGLWVAASALIHPYAASAKDCVRAVRSMSDFDIQGDAWTWWQHSQGRYDRDDQPQAGSVLVFKKTGTLSRGHVSLVSNVVNDRTIEVDHTWLKSGAIRHGMTVIDVSPDNDWSEVRVWNEPTEQMGTHVYPTYGFVLPKGRQAGHPQMVAQNDDSAADADEVSVVPVTRGNKHTAHGSHRNGSLTVAHHGRSPQKNGHVVAVKDGHRDAKGHKVAAAHGGKSQKVEVASARHQKPGIQVAMAHSTPARKPATVASAKSAHKSKQQVAAK